jgi:N-acetylmuramoyl-L-alanine amidase
MIALLAAVALFQVGGAVPASITVRHGDRASTVPVVTTRLGAMVRANDVLAPLGAALMRDSPERFRLIVAGSTIEVQTGIAVARVGGTSQPLASAPATLDGTLYVPLSLLTDVIPRTLPGFRYDASGAELTRASDQAAGRPATTSPQAARTSAPPTAAPAARASPSRATPAGAAVPSDGPSRSANAEPAVKRRRPVVVVDAGHGGRDRGMRGPMGRAPTLYEADITLSIARKLRDDLTKRGIDVVMTRDADTLIALRDRGRIANRAQGDLFVSIHVNAANPRWRTPGAARGFETYFLSEAKTEDERRVAALENEAVKYEVEDGASDDDPLSFILNDMKQNEYLRESSELAATVQRGLRSVHPGTDRGVKQAGFVVLNGAYMPSVLVEVGFGTNPDEAAYLRSAAGQAAMARALGDATLSYLERYGSRRSGNVSR